jgi:GntR family transcriptional regulator/MocR family aminotransferase
MTILGIEAGFHLFLEFDSHKSEMELKKMAAKVGIRIASAEYTWHTKTERTKRQFILGFCGIEENKIESGIEILSNIWSR